MVREVSLLAILVVQAFCDVRHWQPDSDATTTATVTKWALIVAGSSGWDNYRHQADACHAYHVVKSHGIDDNHIVVMMYDDIAAHESNPFPGKIFNSPTGKDVYAGVAKDYTGRDVTPHNFLKVLAGEDMTGVGSGKTIKSGPDDHVFVYFTDHGGSGLIAFPFDYLYVSELSAALKKKKAANQFKQLVFYLEACESGSMFRNVLPASEKIYAITASTYDESSWAVYCDNALGLPCMGDEFSVNWMNDSDVETLTKETLAKQFNITRSLTIQSTVQRFGDIAISKENVAAFQGATSSADASFTTPITGYVSSRDAPIDHRRRAVLRARTAGERLTADYQLKKLVADRAYVDMVMHNLVAAVHPTPLLKQLALTNYPKRLNRNDCNKAVLEAFHHSCFNLGQNGHAMSHVHKLNNLCEVGAKPTDDVVKTVVEICSNLREKPTNVE